MALRFLDGFDHYTTVSQKWSLSSNAVIIAPGRTAPYQLGLTQVGYSTITLDAQGTWVIGFAFSFNGPNILKRPIYTYDVAAVQGALRINGDYTLSLSRGGVIVATSTRSLIVNTWYYIEFKHIIADAGGTLEVRVNEEVWATFNGDTQETANPTANVITLGDGNTIGANYYFYDDLYILDGTGAAPNNDYWGDTQVERLLPNGAGFYTEWATLVGAATHWQAVSEVPPNDDTSYVGDNVVGSRDIFTMGNLSVISAQINGVQVLVRGREDAAGGVSIARMYRNAGVDNQGADVAINTGYAYWIREIMATDPIAAGAWTVANVNAAEFGVRVRP